MTDLRFDGQVAIVTGAGGQPPNLGRAYAHLLASRGAKVVVNDLGVGPVGQKGVLEARAEVVAQEIVDAGFEAVADTNSVAGAESARAIVQKALDTWGRIDIVINNAGVLSPGLLDEVADADHEKVIQSHVMGNIWMCRAAWPHMKEAGYGRIVNISSSAAFGVASGAVYGAAKAAVLGLSLGLGLEGAPHDIKVNAVAPRATTAKHAYLASQSPANNDIFKEQAAWTPEQVAPLVAYLVHADCPVSGKFINAAGGHFNETVFGITTRGYSNPGVTLEDVRDNFASIVDRSDLVGLPDVEYAGS
jgi:NAD(P)-dependent dehydrogenase (short-subunit alcohol dehydrogenase family)